MISFIYQVLFHQENYYNIFKSEYRTPVSILGGEKNTQEWKSLLKNRKLYKYFISLDWDKFASQSKNSSIPLTADLSNNELFNEEEFKYLLETGELDKISSDSESETESET